MDERRRRQRTDLDAQLVIKRADGSDIAEIGIEVTDVSITGIGFTCSEELRLIIQWLGDVFLNRIC